jgi:hypothetical protein
MTNSALKDCRSRWGLTLEPEDDTLRHYAEQAGIVAQERRTGTLACALLDESTVNKTWLGAPDAVFASGLLGFFL